jgi:hypothetical protein
MKMLSKMHVSRAVDKADWLIHREMGCDWLVANMKIFEKNEAAHYYSILWLSEIGD